MPKFIKAFFLISISASILSIISIIFMYFITKPNLPEIKYVDESVLQMPLKVLTKDGVLIGEFGEIKRRAKSFDEIPYYIKSAFLAAEDDNFFNHQGISYTGLIRSFMRCMRPSGCEGGGGTITMQVVRGYLLTPEQTISRKIKEIFLALELESNVGKEEIFELYVNRVFLGNRSYGIEAAANTYFNKSLENLSIDESATIAAIAQLPSRINPVKNPRRTLQRRNWILSRMFMLGYISDEEYKSAVLNEIKIANDINLYDIEAKHIAELVRQEVIRRYGLDAYKNGWSVYTTIDSKSQKVAHESVLKDLFLYDKRHGWRKSDNYENIFSDQQAMLLKNLDIDFLFDNSNLSNINLNEDHISNKLRNIFDSYSFYDSYIKAIVVSISEKEIIVIDENFELKNAFWSDDYKWARDRISINELGKVPNGFNDFLNFGDFIHLKKNDDYLSLDQVPEAEASLISIAPETGDVIAYVGGKNFNERK